MKRLRLIDKNETGTRRDWDKRSERERGVLHCVFHSSYNTLYTILDYESHDQAAQLAIIECVEK